MNYLMQLHRPETRHGQRAARSVRTFLVACACFIALFATSRAATAPAAPATTSTASDAAPSHPAEPSIDAPGWVSLFSGKSLDGWRANEKPGSFVVVDGKIVCNGPRSHLFYVGPVRDGQFKNFEFQADVMTDPGANSGIYFHTRYQESGWPEHGFEAQVNNTHHGEGGYVEYKKTGSLYGIRNQYKAPASDNRWFRMAIRVVGSRICIWVDGVLVVDYVEPLHPQRSQERAGCLLGSGTFGLQCHDPHSTASFKNIRVKPLPDDLPEEAPRPDSEPFPELIDRHMANFPVIDFHSHLKGGLVVADVLDKSLKTGIQYGIAPNCGIGFPITNDVVLRAFLTGLKGKPVFAGMQAEGREWVTLFSKQAIAEADYIFTDSMTFTDRRGRRMRLWIDNEVFVDDKQEFMDMLVEKIEGIFATEPIDIYANATFLPSVIAREYDTLWSETRMDRVIAAAVRHEVAMEINSRFRIPSAAFIKRAKAAGVKFSFGTNNAGKDDLGNLEYSLQMARECGLTSKDLFLPRPAGQKKIQTGRYDTIR